MKICDLLRKQKNNTSHWIRDDENVLNYAEWHKRSSELSDKIKKMQIYNESIIIYLPNSINYAVAYFGILYSGNVVVPIDIRARQIEIESTICYCEAKIIITDQQHYIMLQDMLTQYTYAITIYVIDIDNFFNFNTTKPYIEQVAYDFSKEDVIIMLHTSGTTSNPKRVMLTNKNLISNIESNIMSLKLSQSDVVLIMLPMCFGYCNTAQFLTHTYLGSNIVIYNAVFFAKQFFEMVNRYYVTCFTAVPYMLYKLLAYNKDDSKSTLLRYICFGGSKINEEKLKLLIDKYPEIGFVHTYGQTECSPRLTALLPQDSIRKIGSVGKPIPGVDIIIQGMKQNVDKNVVGEILVRGKNVMKGYFRQVQLTNTDDDGWHHTGDVGYLDNEGYLYITGRIKNMLISGGQNIYPEEVEEIILSHDSVQDVYVYGQKHDMLGEVPVADVVMVDEDRVNELQGYLKSKLAGYKIPVKFNLVNKLFKTYNGKIKRTKSMEENNEK